MQSPSSSDEKAEAFRERTRSFGLSIVKMVGELPRTQAGRIMGGQLLRSGMSVGANYRAACRARTRAEFLSKMGIVEEEADETVYWIDMLEGAGLVKGEEVADLKDEADQILAMVVSSIRTARRNR